MDTSVAQFRRFMWKVGKPCAHPKVEPETTWGRETGQFVCTACGQSFTHAGKLALDAKRTG